MFHFQTVYLTLIIPVMSSHGFVVMLARNRKSYFERIYFCGLLFFFFRIFVKKSFSIFENYFSVTSIFRDQKSILFDAENIALQLLIDSKIFIFSEKSSFLHLRAIVSYRFEIRAVLYRKSYSRYSVQMTFLLIET